MAVNYNLGSRLSSPKLGAAQGNKPTSNIFTYGRVTDIVVDAFHPLYEENGKGQALYGVEYVDTSNSADISEEGIKQFAYCGLTSIKKLPLKNEIVILITGPGPNYRDTSNRPTTKYWIDIVPLWNHVHHNGYPDTLQTGEGDADFGKYFEEQTAVNNLQLFPGDTVLESRHGSSIRLGGTKFDSNELTDSTNNMKPFTIIRNGQVETKDGLDTVLEDINKDASSIYLTFDHKLPLKQSNEKRKGFDEEPEKADSFKGPQVVINSGRLYFNARDEGAYISSKEELGLNSQIIGIDGVEYIGLDAKKIYLGNSAFGEAEPVLKGQISIDWMLDFLNQFETLTKGIATAPPAPPTFIAKCIATANSILPLIPVLKQQLNMLLSKKVFTE